MPLPDLVSAPVDVAIIGGGITGCAASWYLARAGLSVALLEADELNREASGSNSGSLHGQIPQDTFLDLGDAWAASFAPTLRLLHASIDLWKEADVAFEGCLSVRAKGGLMLAASEREMRDIERKARYDRAAGSAIEILSGDELRRRLPFLSSHLVGAGFCSGEGKADPLIAAPSFASAAEGLGARIFTGQRLQSLERSGKAYRLQCSGGILEAARIVIAAGAGSSAVAMMAGVNALPIQEVPIQACVTEPLEPLTDQLLYYARAPLTMKQTPAGTLIIGGGWPARFDHKHRPVTDPESLAQNLGLALEVIPSLANVALVRTWAASVNGTPDWKPIIGELPGLPGIFLSYVPWMGFTGGPAAAYISACQVQGKDVDLDIDVSSFAPR